MSLLWVVFETIRIKDMGKMNKEKGLRVFLRAILSDFVFETQNFYPLVGL